MTIPDAPAPPRRPGRPVRPRWTWTALAAAVVAILSVYIVLSQVPTYLTLDPEASRIELHPDSVTHFPFVVVHAATGGLALLVGPLQFSRWLRRRGAWHRWIGRVYLFAGVLPSALAGIGAALLTVSGPISTAAFLLLDAVWITTALLAYRAARHRRFTEHREWMLRNFALTFSAVTLRLWLAVLIAMQLPWLDTSYGGDFDRMFDTAYAVTHWLAWLPNLLLVEVYLGREARRALRAARRG